MSLSEGQRERVVRDIINHQEQVSSAGNAYERTIRNMSDNALENEWRATVGRWVLSIDEISVPDDISPDNWLDKLFERVVEDEDVPYGFV